MTNTRKPEVTLFSNTSFPLESISLAVSAWTSDDFQIDADAIDIQPNVDKALKAYHRTALEFCDMVFVIKNVSRAFQQQLTRTRQAGYSIQSLRVVTKEGFASSGRYLMPPGLNKGQQNIFHASMMEIEHMYKTLLQIGIPIEDARGLLPLNVHSDIAMHINFSSLSHMSAQRLCVNTQWEYRQVVNQMKQRIGIQIGSELSDSLDAPCVKARKCPMRDEYCGIPFWKYSSEKRVDMYKRFINFNMKDKVWNIKWLDDKEPDYLIGD